MKVGLAFYKENNTAICPARFSHNLNILHSSKPSNRYILSSVYCLLADSIPFYLKLEMELE